MIDPQLAEGHATMTQDDAILHGFDISPNKENKDHFHLTPPSERKIRGFSPFSPPTQEKTQLERPLQLSSSPAYRKSEFPRYGADSRLPDNDGQPGLQPSSDLISPYKRLDILRITRPNPIQFMVDNSRDKDSVNGQQQGFDTPSKSVEEPLSFNRKRRLVMQIRKISSPPTNNTENQRTQPMQVQVCQTKQTIPSKAKPSRQRKAQYMEDSGNEEDYGGVCQNRTRGLRHLSTSVRDIVFQLKKTTYKEVAGKLISRLLLNQGDSANDVIYCVNQVKEEQNIKRRVYDALNVLIAAGVLKKEGKVVQVNDKCNHDHPLMAEYQKKKDQLSSQIQQAEASIQAKIKMYQILELKREAKETLIKRNKSSQVEESQQIKIPFASICFKKQELNPSSLLSQHSVKLGFKSRFEMMTDMDVLLLLNSHGLLQKEGRI